MDNDQMDDINPVFIPGLELSRIFYQQAVKPILDKNFSELSYSAALIGGGSEVLGYDTALSRDHNWGPRVTLFLSERDYPLLKDRITQVLSENLPYIFMGYSINFSLPEPNGVRCLADITSSSVNHRVDVFTTRSFFETCLKLDPFLPLTVIDWLTFPQQILLELVSGEVFYDGLDELNQVRGKFAYYPGDVWLYVLASQWTKISQEEAFAGRCSDVSDELGSQIVAARIVRELMRLCFLMEKTYAPYSKWFGTAFSRLRSAKALSPVLRNVLLAESMKEREGFLSEAYKKVAELHNALGITEPLPTHVSTYHDRPYLVIHADRFADAIRRQIKDAEVMAIKSNIGSVDQFMDSTDVLSSPEVFSNLEIWSSE